jgi:hypothetical protein
MRHIEIFNSKILGEKWQSQSWETKSHHSCKLPSTVFTVLTTNLILVKTRGFTIHACLWLIHGQMRMNMTHTQYTHRWYTTIFVPDVSWKETNSCLFPTYRPGTNFRTSCQCMTRLATQSSGFLEALQHLGDSKMTVSKAVESHSKLACSYNCNRM